MSPADEKNTCSECGFPLEAHDSGCPRCLLAGALEENPTVPGEEFTPWQSLEKTGEVIDRYKLIDLIGEGGMGQVFVAEQRQPFLRKVALKLIKPGMDSKEVLSRFEAERQAIALMDHAGIARVYDAGTTENGLPYFVMELVEGKPITEFCDEKKLSLKERLDLFRQVCQAVQHAHQKGIIHRDLKPSNILVTTDPQNGDQPAPKIIDFGVAKALGPGLTEHTLYTAAGQIIGTPQYMSPEQAMLDATDVDTRADIYSLGVLLYELLTGRTPLEMAALRKAGLEAVLRTIREDDAPRPSAKVSKLENASRTTIADARKIPISKLTHSLRGDLDWIVMKALEKERSRRYETANAFAADIGRYLAHQAVEASPPSPGYRFKKFAVRNKGIIGAVATVFAVLIAGIAATAWQAQVARDEEARALAARKEAEKLVAFMMGDLSEKLARIGKLELMEGVEEAVTRYFESATDGKASQSLIVPMARNLMRQSETYRKQGRLTEAVEILSGAIATLEENEAQWGADVFFELSKALYQRSKVENMRRQTNVAALDRDKAYRLLTKYTKAGKLTRDQTELLAEIKGDIAIYQYVSLRDLTSAQATMSEVLGALRDQIEDYPDSTNAKLLFVQNRIRAFTILRMGILDKWDSYYDFGNTVAILKKTIAENPGDARLRADIVRMLINTMPYGRPLLDLLEAGEKGEGVSPLILAKELVELDPGNKEWKILLGRTYFRIGYKLSEGSHPLESLPYFDEALRVLTEIEDDQVGISTISLIAEVYSERGLANMARDKFASRNDYRDGYELMKSHIDLVRKDADWASQMAELQFRLAGGLSDSEEALQLLRDAEELLDPVCKTSPSHEWLHRTMMYVKNGLARRFQSQADHERAKTKYTEAIAICQRFQNISGGWTWRYANTLKAASANAFEMGDLEYGAELKRQEIPLRKALLIENFRSGFSDYIEIVNQSLLIDVDFGIDIEEELQFIHNQYEQRKRDMLFPELICEKISKIFRIRAEIDFSAGNTKKAEEFLDEAEKWLLEGWANKSKSNRWISRLPAAMYQTGSLRKRMGDKEGSDQSFKLSKSWLKWSNEMKLPELKKRSGELSAAWESGDRQPRVVGDLLVALVVLGQIEQKIGDFQMAETRYLKAIDIASAIDSNVRKNIAPHARGHVALAYENIGELASKKKDWLAAENYYKESLKVWLEPDIILGVPGHLLANRPRVRLALLYRNAGKKDDPQCKVWCQQACDELDPLETAGTLHYSLKWVLNAARSFITQ